MTSTSAFISPFCNEYFSNEGHDFVYVSINLNGCFTSHLVSQTYLNHDVRITVQSRPVEL